jgi:hypothetical protein
MPVTESSPHVVTTIVMKVEETISEGIETTAEEEATEQIDLQEEDVIMIVTSPSKS